MTHKANRALANISKWTHDRFETLATASSFAILGGAAIGAPIIDPSLSVADYYQVQKAHFLLYAVSAIGTAIATIGAITFGVCSIIWLKPKPPSPKHTCCHRH